MKIREMGPIPLRLPVSRPIKAGNALIRKGAILRVRIRTEEGLHGAGECAVAPYFKGREKPRGASAIPWSKS